VNLGLAMLAVGAVLAASVVAALGAARFGFPALVAFLGLGMLLGSDGPGGIAFDDARLAREAGVVSLVAILYEGGLSTSWRNLRKVAAPALTLATAGVGVTAVATGLAAHALFPLTWTGALLLGAVVASTDAAAVFATLRHTRLPGRLARTLEAESGTNDPVAIALTLGLIAWIQREHYGVADLAWVLLRQLGVGLVVGIALGALATLVFTRIPSSIASFVPVLSVAAAAVAYGGADAAHGSGFLAVYIVGLAVGSTSSAHRAQIVAFHEGLAYVAQVALFIVLGLLVFPSRLPHVALAGLGLTAVLVFVARPLAVWTSTAPLRRFSRRERVLLGWAGLRGAVPIVLATFVLSAHVGSAETIFNAVFFVVLVSAALQGTTLEWLARRLGLLVEAEPA
jgi:cell volume regulation protein A